MKATKGQTTEEVLDHARSANDGSAQATKEPRTVARSADPNQRNHRPRIGSAGWIWFGVAIVAVGFGLIALAWGQTAGQTQVFRQVPYLVSAGMTGLGVIMAGLTLLNVVTRERDRLEQERHIDELTVVLEELRVAVADLGRGGE